MDARWILSCNETSLDRGLTRFAKGRKGAREEEWRRSSFPSPRSWGEREEHSRAVISPWTPVYHRWRFTRVGRKRTASIFPKEKAYNARVTSGSASIHWRFSPPRENRRDAAFTRLFLLTCNIEWDIGTTSEASNTRSTNHYFSWFIMQIHYCDQSWPHSDKSANILKVLTFFFKKSAKFKIDIYLQVEMKYHCYIVSVHW